MNIHPVTHVKGDKNRFCGPAVLSILTGMTSGEGARLVRHISGSKLVKGTETWEILRALNKCGLMTKRIPVPVEMRTVVRKGSWIQRGGTYIMPKGALTLAGWLKQSVPIRTAGRVFLIVAGNHWQIITGRRYCCGQTGEIVSINHDKVKRRARVTEVYEVLSKPGEKIRIPAEARKPKASSKINPSRRELEQFLKANGIPKGKLVRYDSVIRDYVIPPCDHFPLGFSTMHHGWEETFYRVDYCFENPEVLLEDGGHYSA